MPVECRYFPGCRIGRAMDLMKWMRDQGCPRYEPTCLGADEREAGRVTLVRITDVGGICEEAARGGYLNILRWARENGLLDEKAAISAWYGHWDILQWLRQQGCPRDSRSVPTATRPTVMSGCPTGHRRRCIYTESVFTTAVRKGHLDLLSILPRVGRYKRCENYRRLYGQKDD